MKRSADIHQILRPLKETPFQAYLSNAVQVADILEWILSQVGIAEVWQTSFSISEEFLRRLFFITKDKKVSRINLVLDHKATNKTLKLWAFITQVIERTYLADNHSKILLVRSEVVIKADSWRLPRVRFCEVMTETVSPASERTNKILL